MQRQQAAHEELANVITHGLGILFFAIAIPFLIVLSVQHLKMAGIIAAIIFSIGLLSVYLSSTIYHYHWQSEPHIQYALQVWDHISIYLLIGGSYTVILYQFTDHSTFILYMLIIWSLIAVGSVFKIYYTGRFRVLSVFLYLALSWMAVFIAGPLQAAMPAHVFSMIVWGGMFYTFGTIFYIWHQLRFSHAVWHLFVLAGSIFHFVAVYSSIPAKQGF